MKYVWECYPVAGFKEKPQYFPSLDKAIEYIWKDLWPSASADLERAYGEIKAYMPDRRGEAAVAFLKKMFSSSKGLTEDFCLREMAPIFLLDEAKADCDRDGESERIWFGGLYWYGFRMQCGDTFEVSFSLPDKKVDHEYWFSLRTIDDEDSLPDYEIRVRRMIDWGSSAYPLFVLNVLDGAPRKIEEIIKRIEEKYYVVIERKAIGRHIELLKAVGYNIKKKGGYYLDPDKPMIGPAYRGSDVVGYVEPDWVTDDIFHAEEEEWDEEDVPQK